MSIFKKLVFLLVIFIFISAIPSSISFLGITPNLLLAAVVCLAFFSELPEAGFWGFLAGAIFDLLFSRVFGFTAIFFMYCGLLVKALDVYFYRRSVFTVLGMTFLVVFFYESAYFFFNFYIWGNGGWSYALLNKVFPIAISTTVWQLPVYWISTKLERRVRR